jgi:phage shock protein PspC (stress-responsive transcriptional regulator)
MIAGVCAALARRFDMKPWHVRLIFVVSCLLPGPQFLLYVALWIILPARVTSAGGQNLGKPLSDEVTPWPRAHRRGRRSSSSRPALPSSSPTS